MSDPIPAILIERLRRELAPGERVVWHARPAPLNRVLASGTTFLFGIPFFAFAVFWTWGATGHFGGPDTPANHAFGRLAWLWGGMFVVAGAAMLLSPLWVWWLARHTLYAVTERRALLIEAPLRGATVQSFSAKRLADVVRYEYPDGRGNLVFERLASKGAKGRTVYRNVGFFGLADARSVEALLPDAAGTASRAPVAQRGVAVDVARAHAAPHPLGSL